MGESELGQLLRKVVVPPAVALDLQRGQLAAELEREQSECMSECKAGQQGCVEVCARRAKYCGSQVDVQYSVPVTRLNSCISACSEKNERCVARCGAIFKANCESCQRAVQRVFEACVKQKTEASPG